MSRQTHRIKHLTRQAAKLSVREKAALLEGVNAWHTRAVPHLGIPALYLTDGPHGLRRVRREKGGFGVSDNLPSSAFPTAAAVACSWDPENARRLGEAIALECLEAGVDILLAPGVNIKRSPLCGRNFEYFSEDPLLSGAFGEAFVQGAQGRGVGCCVKHFAANSNEDYRFVGDSLVDERALREIYLRAFERIVKRASPYAVMCAYNRVNGVWASENKWLLTDVLRDEWGFDGLVMTDWGAARDRVAGVAAGCDLDMPGGVRHSRKALIRAAESGALSAADMDRAAARVLVMAERCAVGRVEPDADKAVLCDGKDMAALSAAIAVESAVLLKNDGVLPLGGGEKLLVAGEFFEKMRFQGAGSSLVNPPAIVTPRDAFERRQIRYRYEKGFRCFYAGRCPELEEAALEAARQADTVLFFAGLTDFEESEGFDRSHMRLSDNQIGLLTRLLDEGCRVVLVLFAGAPVELPFFDRLAAVLYMGLPGMAGGEAAAALLFGEANPSGKLAESWPLSAADSSCAADFGKGPVSQYYESVYVGYRFYDKAGTRLRFPFGFGLSYTTFAYRDMQVTRRAGTVEVRAVIANTGERDGAEAVQLYVRGTQNGVFRPDKELRAFTKVFLKAGEAREIALCFDEAELAYWHVGRHAWVLENGVYTLCLAASAADVRLRMPLEIRDGEDVPSPYPEEIQAAYAQPPKDPPICFADMVPAGVAPPGEGAPLSLESPLRDYPRTPMGRRIYRLAMALASWGWRRARKLPDSLERDSRLKNAYFMMKMTPSNSMRCICMSSGGRFPYRLAAFAVELAGGHGLRALRALLTDGKGTV